MKIYTVTMNSAVDVVVSEKDYRETGLQEAVFIPAGKGINVSRALKSSDIKSTVVAIVGKEDIELFKDLEDADISTFFVEAEGRTRKNITLSFSEDGLEHHERTKGFTAKEHEFQKVYDYLFENVNQSDWVVFSGSLPDGMKKDAYKRLIELCKKKGAYTILDSSQEALLEGLKASPYAIKPNLEELCDILDKRPESVEEIEEALKTVSDDYGVKMILTTLSEKGGIFYIQETGKVISTEALAMSNPIVSSVGCGDSAVAGFVSGFVKGLSYEECLKESMLFANANLYSEVPGELVWDK